MLREFVDPEAPAIEPGVRGGVAGKVAGDDVMCGEFAGGERVVNAFAGERLNYARGAAKCVCTPMRSRFVRGSSPSSRATVEFRPSAATSVRA